MLVRELASLPRETTWLELKENKAVPDEIGANISALANSAVLAERSFAYIIWGIRDDSHEIVGTSFSHHDVRKGNEPLEPWLWRLLEPDVRFEFHAITVEGKSVVLLEIERAQRRPVRFQGEEYIRLGPHTKKLKDLPEKERELWRAFDRAPFEQGLVLESVEDERVTSCLDHDAYFTLTGQRVPDSRSGIVEALAKDALVVPSPAGRWSVTNLGALLFAKKLDDFPTLRRKAIRVVVYDGTSRIRTKREQVGGRGYASGFSGLIDFIMALVPTNEELVKALRETRPMYPDVAVRELVANALIHQDLFVTGAGPMVEIFDDRMEITNPGVPLIDVERFLDNPPRSRNETMAALMRRMHVCEERGSGIDKVVSSVEAYQLPAPLFEVVGDSTRAVLFAHRPLARMDRDDRIRACYLHACLRYVSHDYLTNTSLRERFGIDEKNSAMASRLIKEAVDAGRVAPEDADASKRLMRYVPYWAVAPRAAHDGRSS